MWGILSYFFLNKLVFYPMFIYASFLSFIGLIMVDFSWPTIFSLYGLLDQVNIGLILLTFMMIFIMVFESKSGWLLFNIYLLGLLLIFCFLVSDMMLFYMFFELSLIPTMYMIFAWGVQPERLSAASYFMIYALVGSFPLLVKIMSFMKKNGAYIFFLNFYSKTKYLVKFLDKNYLKMFWVLSFMMKLPVYSMHLWLPKAHVEAPVFGSMILAAVLLKLGGYGLIRISKFKIISSNYFMFWVMLSSIIVGLITFRTKDMKSLIAYSSMAHMAFTLVFFYYLNLISLWAVFFMLMGHGFISSGMFHSFNMLYSNTHSRNIFLKKGKKNNSSVFYFMFFFILCLNSSLPMKMTFFSEFIVGMMLYMIKKYLLFIFFLSVFLVGLFKMNLFLITNQGNSFNSLKNWSSKNFSFLGVFCAWLHIYMNFFMVYKFINFF